MNLKLTLLPLALLCAVCTMAQTGNKTIDSKLAVYAEKVKAGNYYEAILRITEVREMTDSLMANQVAEALPKEVGDWKLTNDSKQGSPMPSGAMPPSMSTGSTINVSRFYKSKKEVAAADSLGKQIPSVDPHAHAPDGAALFTPALYVTISNNAMETSNVLMMYSESGPSRQMPGVVTTSMKVKNHRAILQTNESMKTAELNVIVGAAVVKIMGQAMKDSGDLEKLANAIDFAKIKAILGE